MKSIDEKTKTVGYYVCVNGVIWTVYQSGEHVFTNSNEEHLAIEGESVQILGAKESPDDSGRLIEEEYTLHRSLIDLALLIDQPSEVLTEQILNLSHHTSQRSIEGTTKTVGYYVCVNGVIWTVYQSGEHVFTNSNEEHLAIEGESVQILGAKESPDDSGRLIEEEYTLHKSIIDLALLIEQPSAAQKERIFHLSRHAVQP
ncbi:hypothetical protein [Vibrio sp. 10N.239.312.D08]|uniref:hypothetical protein n=1 Tax=Vibrio sp. 10N.239.312.D08 TaxID=3229978 RepID=UPI0035513A73